MFCKWCGRKRKSSERVCSNCHAPFGILESIGVSNEFAAILRGKNDADRYIFNNVNDKNDSDYNKKSTNNDIGKVKKDIYKRYNDLKCVLIFVIIFFSVIVILLLAKVGQLTKKDIMTNGNIYTESEVVSEPEKTDFTTNAKELEKFTTVLPETETVVTTVVTTTTQIYDESRYDDAIIGTVSSDYDKTTTTIEEKPESDLSDLKELNNMSETTPTIIDTVDAEEKSEELTNALTEDEIDSASTTSQYLSNDNE